MARKRSGTEDTAVKDETAQQAQPAAVEGEKKTRVRKELGSLDFTALKVVVVTNADTMRDFKRSRGERHPEQVAVDNLVRKAYETWVAAGKPTTWTESRGLKLTVPVEQWDTLKTRVQRAGSFYDFAIRFSDVKEADGHAEVLLVVKDKNVKSENATDVDEDDEDDSGDDGSEEEFEGEETQGTEDSDAAGEPDTNEEDNFQTAANEANENSEEFAAV